MAVDTSGAPRPRARGWIHRVAFFVSMPAGLLLVAQAPTLGTRIAAAIYALSLLALFGVSSTYHRGTWTVEERARWQRLDHATIFLLIAGTYTPYCVLALSSDWKVGILIAVWAGGVIGALVKVYRVDLHALSGTMYLGLGWIGLLVFPQLVRALTPAELTLTVTGGVLYTAGALVLARHSPDPFPRTFGYHEVWHACTGAAAACHYTVVLLMLIRA